MQKDWAERFAENSIEDWRRRTVNTCLLILLFLSVCFCLIWTVFVIEAGFRNSMGKPRNSDFAGHVRVYAQALTPAAILAGIGIPVYLSRSRHRKATKRRRP
jgi:hypothetical protein